MTQSVYYDNDIDLTELLAKQIAIVGYGAQGRAHALNLRDSGCDVTIGQRPGPGFEAAAADGFRPQSISAAAAAADVVGVMLPDECHGRIFDTEIAPRLSPGKLVICCHGFSLHYRQLIPPAGVNALLVAPKGAGHMVRKAYSRGGGVPCFVALGPDDQGLDETAQAPLWSAALAYAKAIGGGRAGIMKSTVVAETETDLFGEQAVLCGGISHLVTAAFDILVEAGYQPEMAYFECVHELKLVVDLLHEGGLGFMHEHISNTAEYGDYTRGGRVINEETKQRMREVLAEIQSGKFASEWLAESESGGKNFQAMRQKYLGLAVEKTGQQIREMLGNQ